MAERILWWDQRKEVRVDSDEFEIIKMMVVDAGATDMSSPGKVIGVIGDLVRQGYDRHRAQELVILARKDLKVTSDS